MNKDRYLVVVSGPSGCGKDTVVKTMREKHPEIEVSVSATSRAMREGEAEGVNYYYMTRETFQQKVQAGEILEYTQYNGNLYGTPKHEVDTRIAQGRTVILVIEVEGAGNIRKLYPEALTIFLLPPSMEELENRLRSRGTESEEAIQAHGHRPPRGGAGPPVHGHAGERRPGNLCRKAVPNDPGVPEGLSLGGEKNTVEGRAFHEHGTGGRGQCHLPFR